MAPFVPIKQDSVDQKTPAVVWVGSVVLVAAAATSLVLGAFLIRMGEPSVVKLPRSCVGTRLVYRRIQLAAGTGATVMLGVLVLKADVARPVRSVTKKRAQSRVAPTPGLSSHQDSRRLRRCVLHDGDFAGCEESL